MKLFGQEIRTLQENMMEALASRNALEVAGRSILYDGRFNEELWNAFLVPFVVPSVVSSEIRSN